MPARASVRATCTRGEVEGRRRPSLEGGNRGFVLMWSATARCYGDWNWSGAAEGDGGDAGLGAGGVMLALVRAKMSGLWATIPIVDAISMARGKAPPSGRVEVIRRRGDRGAIFDGVMAHLAEVAGYGCAARVRRSRR